MVIFQKRVSEDVAVRAVNDPPHLEVVESRTGKSSSDKDQSTQRMPMQAFRLHAKEGVLAG